MCSHRRGSAEEGPRRSSSGSGRLQRDPRARHPEPRLGGRGARRSEGRRADDTGGRTAPRALERPGADRSGADGARGEQDRPLHRQVQRQARPCGWRVPLAPGPSVLVLDHPWAGEGDRDARRLPRRRNRGERSPGRRAGKPRRAASAPQDRRGRNGALPRRRFADRHLGRASSPRPLRAASSRSARFCCTGRVRTTPTATGACCC